MLVLALPALELMVPPLRLSVVMPQGERTTVGAVTTRNGLPGLTGDRIGASRADGVRISAGPEAPPAQWPMILAGLWLLGVALGLARLALALSRARTVLRRASPLHHPLLRDQFARLLIAAGIRRPVRLRISSEVFTPAAMGILHPSVVIPVGADRWAPEDLNAALIHELGHVARSDYLVDLLGQMARLVYWCNPLVWLAVRRLAAERECACDDRVLRSGTKAEAYANLLLSVARTARLNGSTPAAVAAMARPSELESRLLAVLDPRVRRDPLPAWMPTTLACIGLMLGAPMAALRLEARAPRGISAAAGMSLPEPDQLRDSLADPASERVPSPTTGVNGWRQAAQSLTGPDRALARALSGALDHVPQHRGDLVRERAVWALAQVRDGQLIEPLLEKLEDQDWRVQAYAAWSLSGAHDPRAVPRLIPLLTHPVWRLRAMVAFALRNARDLRAEPAMANALNDPAWQVRVEAVEYFAALDDSSQRERLRPLVHDRHVAVRLAASRSLTTR
jgi:beta-lactamase regulating signal transducer with metallopeptidase domain